MDDHHMFDHVLHGQGDDPYLNYHDTARLEEQTLHGLSQGSLAHGSLSHGLDGDQGPHPNEVQEKAHDEGLFAHSDSDEDS